MRSREFAVSVEAFDGRLEASGRWSPGDPGNTSGPPERCWPPEPAEIEELSRLVLYFPNGDAHGIDLLAVPCELLSDDFDDKIDAVLLSKLEGE